jgi:hypothetical protein
MLNEDEILFALQVQFPCFTGTKLQILNEDEIIFALQGMRQHLGELPGLAQPGTTQFTCFTGTKVKKLT